MQNPIKTAVQSRVSGALGGAFFGLGVLGPIGQGMMAVSIIVGAALFAVHEYQVIVISNQEMEASRFDAQSVLAANHLTPQQAAANLAAGVVINGLDGKPIIGKSLETLTTYLQGQAKAQAESVVAAVKSEMEFIEVCYRTYQGRTGMTGVNIYCDKKFDDYKKEHSAK